MYFSEFNRQRAVVCVSVIFLMILTVFPSIGIAGIIRGKKTPDHFSLNEAYYHYDNLQEAANDMRSDALKSNVDIFEVPSWNDRELPPENKGVISVKASHYITKHIKVDRSFLKELTSEGSPKKKTGPLTVLIVFNRALSVDETARLLEKNVRFRDRMGYSSIVTATVDVLQSISKEDYFVWMDQFTKEYKGGYQCDASPSGSYLIKYFSGGIDKEALRSLDELGLTLLENNPRSKMLEVSGRIEDVQKLLDLGWAYYIFPHVESVEYGNPAHSGNRD